MGKPTAVQNVEFLPHLSANPSCKGESFFLKIGGSVLISEQFTALSAGAKDLFIAMSAESGKPFQRFIFSEKSANRYGISYSTVHRRGKELEAAGFLKVDRAGVTREYNFYSLITDWKRREKR